MPKSRKMDELLLKTFAKLLVIKGIVSKKIIIDSIKKLTEKERKHSTLAKLFIKKRVLHTNAYKNVLQIFKNTKFECYACGKQYKVGQIVVNNTINCPDCDIELEEPPLLRDISIDRQSIPDYIGKYKVIDEIGRGGMGVVYKVLNEEVDRIEALKILKLADNVDEIAIKRFKKEISILGKLSHTNIVPVYNAGKIDDQYFFTMKFIEGETFNKIMSDKKRLDISLEIVERVARAIDYAHNQNIIHRDLKPANIVITKDNKPYITDFGIAKDFTSQTMLTQEGCAVGTYFYISPEQIEGKKDLIGPGVDIYALGVMLYEIATYTLPFKPTSLAAFYKIVTDPPVNPRKLNPKINSKLESIILKAMAKKVKQRHPSCNALAEDLYKFRTSYFKSKKKKSGKSFPAEPKFKYYIVGILCVLMSLFFMFSIIKKIKSRRNSKPKAVEIEKDNNSSKKEKTILEKKVSSKDKKQKNKKNKEKDLSEKDILLTKELDKLIKAEKRKKNPVTVFRNMIKAAKKDLSLKTISPYLAKQTRQRLMKFDRQKAELFLNYFFERILNKKLNRKNKFIIDKACFLELVDSYNNENSYVLMCNESGWKYCKYYDKKPDGNLPYLHRKRLIKDFKNISKIMKLEKLKTEGAVTSLVYAIQVLLIPQTILVEGFVKREKSKNMFTENFKANSHQNFVRVQDYIRMFSNLTPLKIKLEKQEEKEALISVRFVRDYDKKIENHGFKMVLDKGKWKLDKIYK